MLAGLSPVGGKCPVLSAHRMDLVKRDSLVWIEIRGGGRRSEVRLGQVGLCFEIENLECGCLGGTLAETAVVGYIVLLIQQRYASAPADGQCKVNSRIMCRVNSRRSDIDCTLTLLTPNDAKRHCCCARTIKHLNTTGMVERSGTINEVL
jgi:hypothetical protein